MNIVQIQNRVQELPNTPQTMQYLNAAMNGRVPTVPPYVAAAELKRRETEGMMDQLAKGAAKGPQPTVKDQLEEKMGIMALMGQAQPPQRPQIPQPAGAEPQPQAEGGIDNLPVKEDMFGMADGGIVAFNGETGSYATRTDVPVFNWLRSLVEAVENTPTRKEQRAAEAAAAQAKREMLARDFTKGMAEEADAARMAPSAPAATDKAPTAKPPGARPPAAAKPPVAPPTTGIVPSAADLAPGVGGRTLEDALGADPAYKKMQALMNAANPYGGPQESQEDYIRRRREGILSQTGGKMPWETSEARLKDIEARRAKEDADYAESTKGRQLDNLLTMISGMGRGSFGNAGVQGIQAVQKVERDQRAEDLRRKDVRDQQAMKLMEIRALNDQAQFELAKGNVEGYDKIQQDIKKLKSEYDLKQAEIAKGIADVGATARKGDVEDKRKREETAEGSRQKGLDRESSERIARIQAAARAAGRAELTPAQEAKLRADAAKAVDAYLKSAPFRERKAAEDPAVKERMIQERMALILQRGYTPETPSPGTPAGGNRPPLSSFQR